MSRGPRARSIAPQPRQTLRVKTVVAWVLALLVVIGSGVAIEGGAGVALSPRSKLAIEVDQLAEDWAAACNDPSPVSVTWVSIPTHKARGIAFLDHPDNSGPPGVSIEIQGSFVCDFFSGPPGAGPVRTFADLAVVVIRPCFRASDYGGLDNFPSLSTIGPPETDSLAGYRPESGAQFVAEFGLSGGPC